MNLIKMSVCMFGLSLMACGGGDDGGDVEPQSVSVEITAADGGEVTVGEAKLAIPAGALAADTTITVDTSTPSGLPEQESLKGQLYDFGPDGTEFLMPAMLELPVDGTPGENQTAVISWLDETTDTWQDVTSTVSGGKVSGEVMHFTKFIVRFKEGAPVVCEFTPCGGDPTGEWEVASACGDLGGGDNPLEQECPDATVEIAASAEGSIVLNGDMSYDLNLTLFGEVNIAIPADCTAQYATCPNEEGWACTGTPATGCDCVITPGDPEVNMESGTWSTDGNNITITPAGEEGDTLEYCVEGNTLYVRGEEGFIIVLTK